MYAGTTLQRRSGNILGAHQKIDRLARKQLMQLLPKSTSFPKIRDILHFEGNNGPDGIKRKSPGKDEPWHHYDPTDPSDTQLLTYISDHEFNLIKALKENNYQRASFEAAWLAHAIVDGLTPAHHYPLEKKIEELWGYPKDQRLTIRQKNIISGNTPRETVSKNWQYWGAKGVWTTHFMFEFGFATAIASLKLATIAPTKQEIKQFEEQGLIGYFKQAAQDVYDMGMYETFYKNGWTRKLAHQSKQQLSPLIIKTVCLAWFSAVNKAKVI